MNRYVVDVNIINKLVDGLIQLEDLPDDGQFIASHIQLDEINRTKDEERPGRLFLVFSKLETKIEPTETRILGLTRFGEGKYSDRLLHNSLKGKRDVLNDEKSNNNKDALIAEVAIKNGYTLLTADYHLTKVAEENVVRSDTGKSKNPLDSRG